MKCSHGTSFKSVATYLMTQIATLKGLKDGDNVGLWNEILRSIERAENHYKCRSQLQNDKSRCKRRY